MRLPSSIKMVEVGPRDGLQNEPQTVPASVRIALIDRLTASGLKWIEAGSFVSPEWVPQMADTAEVMAGIRRCDGVVYSVLTPNMKGFEAARATEVDEVSVFTAVSETFSQKNINCSINESIERFRPVAAAASQAGIPMRGYLSCVLGCPYEGSVEPAEVARVAYELAKLGCHEVSLGDTIGRGTPAAAQRMVDEVAERVPVERLAVHFHDTYGQALANILAVIERGIAAVDSSVAGLGGCPYASGASGNVASEDVLYMLNGLGIQTGVNLNRLISAGAAICETLGRRSGSRVAVAIEGGTE